MEEEKGRNIKGIFPAAILFSVLISHVIPAHDRVSSQIITHLDRIHSNQHILLSPSFRNFCFVPYHSILVLFP